MVWWCSRSSANQPPGALPAKWAPQAAHRRNFRRPPKKKFKKKLFRPRTTRTTPTRFFSFHRPSRIQKWLGLRHFSPTQRGPAGYSPQRPQKHNTAKALLYSRILANGRPLGGKWRKIDFQRPSGTPGAQNNTPGATRAIFSSWRRD